MAFTEDLAPFFKTADFGVAATYSGATVNGIFTDASADQFIGNAGNEVVTTMPEFVCAESDIDPTDVGGSITISGTAYTIQEVHGDGTGVVRVVLSAA